MGRKNQLDKAKATIIRFFKTSKKKAFNELQLYNIINDRREDWGISDRKSVSSIISYLVDNSDLNPYYITSGRVRNPKTIYAWDTNDEYTIVSALKSKSYFTHYSALYLHQLTLQIPKVFYLNSERLPANLENGTLSQETIDRAFAKEQRKTKQVLSYGEKLIYLLNGKYTGNLGVITESTDEKHFHYTDIERTLIDIAVRPAYAGGVFEVIEAYRNSKELVKVEKLKKYLIKLNFLYPYHQVIGFYLQVSGYDNPSLDLFTEKMEFDFYLTYGMRSKEYSSRWRLYYPKGIVLQDA